MIFFSAMHCNEWICLFFGYFVSLLDRFNVSYLQFKSNSLWSILLEINKSHRLVFDYGFPLETLLAGNINWIFDLIKCWTILQWSQDNIVQFNEVQQCCFKLKINLISPLIILLDYPIFKRIDHKFSSKNIAHCNTILHLINCNHAFK